MEALFGVVVGSVLTIAGGFFATWYQAEVATRAAKGNRLRDIYHPMLIATRMAESFAEAEVDELFDENGVMTAEARKSERRKLEKLISRLETATESASWLEFESDGIAGHLRSSMSRLRSVLTAYNLQLFMDQFNDEKGMTRERAKSEREVISKVCYSLGTLLVFHIRQLEASPLQETRRKATRRYEKKKRQLWMWRIRWRLRFLAWRKGKRLSTIEKQIAARSQANAEQPKTS